jgi:hypothetical protein
MVSNDEDHRRQEQDMDKKANAIDNESIGKDRELDENPIGNRP